MSVSSVKDCFLGKEWLDPSDLNLQGLHSQPVINISFQYMTLSTHDNMNELHLADTSRGI